MPSERRRYYVKNRLRFSIFIVLVLAVVGTGVFFLVRSIIREPSANRGNDPAATQSATPPQSLTPDASGPPSIGPSTPAETAITDWRLVLVNPWNELPAGQSIKVRELSNGQAVDERCYPDLQAMMDACRAEGLKPLIISSYISSEKQQELYDAKLAELIAGGMSEEEARIEAPKEVALPGTSEHELGLALDIVDTDNQKTDESQAGTDVTKWLHEHCWEYGFILRYPEDKEAITGMAYESWHYRYVGKEVAKGVKDSGLCLEEYVATLDMDDLNLSDSPTTSETPGETETPSPTDTTSPSPQ